MAMTALEEYGTAVLDGKILAGDKIKRQYEKLMMAMTCPGRWHFDIARAQKPIRFIEMFCRQSQGKIGSPIKLELFQKAMLEAAYGFVDDLDIRQYQEVLDVVGRKNGKTTLLSGINLYMLLGDGEGAPECYCIATARDQAMKGYTECCNMRKQSPLISKHVRKRVSDLYCAENMGYIKPLASNTNSLDGLNGHCIVIDELAAIKNRDLYDLMKQSMSARRQPMLWCITTNGFVRGGIFDAQYDYATGVIDGSIHDDRFLPIIYELPNRGHWTDPKAWIMANPGLGTIKKTQFLADCVQKAKNDEQFLPTVLVKDFNLKENSSSAWLTWDALDNTATFDPAGLTYGIGGIDAADSVDLTAAKLIAMRRDDSNIYVQSMYWIPERKLEEAKNRHHPDDAPYEAWAARGLLRVVPGNKVNKRVCLDWFLELRDEHDLYPLYIGYDPWHMDDSLLMQFEQELGRNVMRPVRQGMATLSQPMKDLKADFEGHRIIYNNNPIDKYCLANTCAKTDINGNVQPDKGQCSTHRIDGTAALLDAYVVLFDKREEYLSLI